MSIGPRRLSVSLTALALAVALAGCGSSQLEAGAPRVYAPPLHGRIPAQVHVLTATRGYPGHRPSLSFTTTDPAKVAKVATMLDRLHPVRPGIIHCPLIRRAPTVTFTFRARRGGPVLSRASTLATGPRGACPGIAFGVRGRAQRILSAQPAFLRQAQRVLGVHLMTK